VAIEPEDDEEAVETSEEVTVDAPIEDRRDNFHNYIH